MSKIQRREGSLTYELIIKGDIWEKVLHRAENNARKDDRAKEAACEGTDNFLRCLHRVTL